MFTIMIHNDFKSDIFHNLQLISPQNIETISFNPYAQNLKIWPYRINAPNKYKHDLIKMLDDLDLKYINKQYMLWIQLSHRNCKLFRREILLWLIKDELYEEV